MIYQEVTRGEQIDGPRSSGEGTRRGGTRSGKWWWQAGPVERCCLCISLRKGVGILATLDVISLVLVVIYWSCIVTVCEQLQETLQEMYNHKCSGSAAESEDCLGMHHAIEQLDGEIHLIGDLGVALYVPAAMASFAGVVGLYAACKSNLLAAKGYLWMWLLRILVSIAMMLTTIFMRKHYDLDINLSALLFIFLIQGIFTAYYVKVIWSFERSLRGTSGDSSSLLAAEMSRLPERGDDV